MQLVVTTQGIRIHRGALFHEHTRGSTAAKDYSESKRNGAGKRVKMEKTANLSGEETGKAHKADVPLQFIFNFFLWGKKVNTSQFDCWD